MKRIIVICTTLLLLLLPTQASASDIIGNSHEQSLLEMADRGVMKGYGNGIYKPNESITRGQFARMLYRSASIKGQTITQQQMVFNDVGKADQELFQAVHTLQRMGVIDATANQKYHPTHVLERQEAARMIHLILQSKSIADISKDVPFMDEATISPSHLYAVKQVAAHGIVNGAPVQGGFVFQPTNTTTRGHVATIFSNFFKVLEQNGHPIPPIISKPYTLAVNSNGKLVKDAQGYESYQEAVQAMTNQASAVGVYKGNTIVRVKSGVGYAHSKNSTVTVYSDPSFLSRYSMTYLVNGREFVLIDQSEKWVKVKIADTIGYVKPEEIRLIPQDFVSKRDYYTVSSAGMIVHYIYDYIRQTYASYEVGPAPVGLNAGETYASTDGVHFISNKTGQKVTHFPYFQFQSIRSTTNYTAAQLDQYIQEVLQQRVRLNPTKYKDALTKSKLIGLGSHLKKVEKEHRVNAMFILAAAIHESDFGMSGNAQTKNNIFGIRVYDSRPEMGTVFKNPTDSVDEFIYGYMNKNYAIPNGAYAKGAAPGHKSSGANVHYASDPNWGAKIAAHMWRLDRALGGLDYQQHQLGMIVSVAGVNVRQQPSTSATTLYRYKAKDLGASGKSGYPVVLLESTIGDDGYTWYKILTDEMVKDVNGHVEFGWVREDLILTIQ